MKATTIIKAAVGCIIAAVAVVVICSVIVTSSSGERCYDSLEDVPHNKAALVLGTSPKVAGGKENKFFTNRIDAAAQLYNAGKVDFIVVSGDNRHANYNEPKAMHKALVEAGIPTEKIFLDFAGFRTLDSVVRMKTIFSQDSFTVISQRFHNERAVYLADANGLDAVGYNALDVTKLYSFKTRLRECLARVKMFLDLCMDKQPHFGGEKIEIK